MKPLVLVTIALLHVAYTQSQCPSTVPACTCENVGGQSRRNIRCTGLTQIPAFNSSPEIFKKLDMDFPNNNIEVIQPNAFSGIKVEEIDMSGPNIKLQSIHPMAFAGLEQHLTIVKLQGDAVLAPPFEQLKNITNLQELELQFFDMPTIVESTKFNYFPYLRTLRLRNMKTTFVSSESFKNQLQELTVFEFANNRVPTFPKPAINKLRKLQHLSWVHNEMTTITYSSFNNLSSLIELDLRGNYIVEMFNGSFIGITDKLQFLSLQLNRLTKESIVPLGHHVWPELEQLNLGHMANFTDIPNGLFRNMPKLANLIIPGNKLRVIKSNDFQGLGNMHALDLSENYINTFKKGALSPMTRLDTLDLRSQYDLSVNPMNFSLDALKGAELALKTLHIQQSHLIDQYAWEAIGAMRNLVNLDISGTGLSDIPPLLFYSHDKLGSLKMTNNNMTVLRQESLYGLKYSLEVIDISYNQLYTIEECVFKGFNKLKYLFASQNSFVCDCNVFGLYQFLKELTYQGLAILTCKNPANVAGMPLITLEIGQFCPNPPISSTCIVFTTTTASTPTTETTSVLTTTTISNSRNETTPNLITTATSNSTIEKNPDFTKPTIFNSTRETTIDFTTTAISNSTIGTTPDFITSTLSKLTTETTYDSKTTILNSTAETSPDFTAPTISNSTIGTPQVFKPTTTPNSTTETTPDFTKYNLTTETTQDVTTTTISQSTIETTPDLSTTTITYSATETSQDNKTTKISNSTTETIPDFTTTTISNSSTETTIDFKTPTISNSTAETILDSTTSTISNPTIGITPMLTTTRASNQTAESTSVLTKTSISNSTIGTTPVITTTDTYNSTIGKTAAFTTTTISNSTTETIPNFTKTTISNSSAETTIDLTTPIISNTTVETILDSTTATISNQTSEATSVYTPTTISNSTNETTPVLTLTTTFNRTTETTLVLNTTTTSNPPIGTTPVLTPTTPSNSITETTSVFTTTKTSNPPIRTTPVLTLTTTSNSTTETTSILTTTTISTSTFGTTPVLTTTRTSTSTIGKTAVFTTFSTSNSTIGTTSDVPLPDIRFGISSETKNTIVISWTVSGNMTYLKNFLVQWKQLGINNPQEKSFPLDKSKRDHPVTGLNPGSLYEICFFVELTESSKQILISCLTGTTKGFTTEAATTIAINGSDKTGGIVVGVLGGILLIAVIVVL